MTQNAVLCGWLLVINGQLRGWEPYIGQQLLGKLSLVAKTDIAVRFGLNFG